MTTRHNRRREAAEIKQSSSCSWPRPPPPTRRFSSAAPIAATASGGAHSAEVQRSALETGQSMALPAGSAWYAIVHHVGAGVIGVLTVNAANAEVDFSYYAAELLFRFETEGLNPSAQERLARLMTGMMSSATSRSATTCCRVRVGSHGIPKDAPPLQGAHKPTPKAAKEKPVQEWQFGPNIDSLPIERNAPASASSQVACSDSAAG